MRDNRVFPEKGLHLGGVPGQTIPVSRVLIIFGFSHFPSYATAFFLAITIILFIGHLFIDVIVEARLLEVISYDAYER
jgi:hypothetical protein